MTETSAVSKKVFKMHYTQYYLAAAKNVVGRNADVEVLQYFGDLVAPTLWNNVVASVGRQLASQL